MEIFIIILLLFGSSFFSATETAFSSVNRIRLKNAANDGNKKAKKVLKLVDNYDKFLSAVLIGNNIVNIALATFSTVFFTKLFAENGASISTFVTTIVVLIFGEITPKTIAKQAPEIFCYAIVDIMMFIQFILSPFVSISYGIQWAIRKVVNIKEDDSEITDELITMVEEAENDGDLEAHESDLITAAIEFNDLDVKDILTPRVSIVAIDIKDSLSKIEEQFRFNTFSRLPVYENSIDNIIGIIHEKDFYALYNSNQPKKSIRSILQNTIFTSPHTKISKLLRKLQASKMHLAVVLDEFGGTAGIITMEDIIEELVGEIWDEHDIVKEYYQKIDDHTFLVKGSCEVDDLFERLNIEQDDEEHDYVTVSGWVTAEFEAFPQVKDSFKYKNLIVTVEKMLERKIEEVKIEVVDLPEEQQE